MSDTIIQMKNGSDNAYPILGQATALLTKNDPDNIVGTIYARRVDRVGNIKFLTVAIQLGMLSNYSWHYAFDLPSGFEASNSVESSCNNGTHTIGILLSGSSLSFSNRTQIAFTDKTFSFSIAYV